MANFLTTRNWVALTVSILFSLSALLAQARTAELVDPAPIKIPESATAEQVHNAVIGGLAQQSWYLTNVISESPRVQEIERSIRSHSMTLRIEYLADSIKLTYANSQNLNYKVTKKKTVIHPNYMVWTQQLADQIKSNLDKGSDFKPVIAPQLQSGNQRPKEPLSAFGQFKFEPTTLDSRLANEQSAIKSGTNLDHNISLAAQPKLTLWNKPEIPRTLQIKTHISDLRFIGTGTRILTGVMAGKSNITVEVTFIDQATAEIIGKTVLRRTAQGNGISGPRADYAMIENVGKDVVSYIDKNYASITGDLTPAEQAQ